MLGTGRTEVGVVETVGLGTCFKSSGQKSLMSGACAEATVWGQGRPPTGRHRLLTTPLTFLRQQPCR